MQALEIYSLDMAALGAVRCSPAGWIGVGLQIDLFKRRLSCNDDPHPALKTVTMSQELTDSLRA